MSAPREESRDAAAIAAEWVSRADRGLTNAEHAELRAWQAQDARHAAEYQRARHAWRRLHALRASPELTAMADEFLARARQRRRRGRLVRWGGWSLGAAAAVLFGLVGWTTREPEWRAAGARFPNENYRVIASTVRRETLPDGSVAEVNGASRIAVDYTRQARRVELLEGEAHFVVEKNPDRPFHVTAGPVTVRAVGTAFNVRLASARIEVLVTEGTVKLEHAETTPAGGATARGAAPLQAAPALVEGQRAVIPRREPIAQDDATAPPPVAIDQVDRAQIDAELGWQSTRLVFNNTPLDEVVEGFNRYNSQRLTLGDPRLRERALTGVFRADNLDGFLRLLKASIDVKAERRTPTETVLLPMR